LVNEEVMMWGGEVLGALVLIVTCKHAYIINRVSFRYNISMMFRYYNEKRGIE